MSGAVGWIEYKGKKILLSDYAGLKGEEFLAAIDATRKELMKLPVGAYHRTLTVITDTDMSPASAAKGQAISDLIRERRLVGHQAIVGASGPVESVIPVIKPGVHLAKTIEEAKDWLVSQPE